MCAQDESRCLTVYSHISPSPAHTHARTHARTHAQREREREGKQITTPRRRETTTQQKTKQGAGPQTRGTRHNLTRSGQGGDVTSVPPGGVEQLRPPSSPNVFTASLLSSLQSPLSSALSVSHFLNQSAQGFEPSVPFLEPDRGAFIGG